MDENELILRQQQQENNAETEKSILEQDERYFDNELLLFISKLSKNQSTHDIAHYIKSVDWTDKQKNKLLHIAKIILSNGLSTAFIDGYRGFHRMKDLKDMTMCDVPVGMTTFDITENFILLCDMIDGQFELELSKSVNGFLIRRISTKTHEIQHEEKTRQKEQGLKEKIGWN